MKSVTAMTTLMSSLLLATCAGRAEAQGAPKVETAVTIDRAVVPARYSAPLPTSVAGLQAWLEGSEAIAPPAHVIDNILAGDTQWLTRLGTAANAVVPAERSAWVLAWSGLFDLGVVEPEFCERVRPTLTGAASTLRAAVSAAFARSCASEADLPLLVRADTPNHTVIEFFDPLNREYEAGARRLPYHPRLAAAVREIILGQDLVSEARLAAFVLIEQRDPAGDAALLAIHKEIKDQERADQVAVAFVESRSKEGRQRAAVACKRIPDDAMCRYANKPAAEALDEDEPEQTEGMDPGKAKARIEQLAAMGFSRVRAVDAAKLGSDAAEVVLLTAGHAYLFDLETDMFPNQHDSLMRGLARLLAPELDGAIFEEQAPKLVEAEGDEVVDEADLAGPYQLTAYAGGKRYRMQAENLGDWYDAGAVLRLMNTLLEDRKSSSRLVILATRDQNAIVVAAPAAAIDKAVKAGLLELGEPGKAERAARGFEDRVIKSLQEADGRD